MDILQILKAFSIVLVILIPTTEAMWKWLPSYTPQMRTFWLALGGVPGGAMFSRAIDGGGVGEYIACVFVMLVGIGLFYKLYGVYARLRGKQT